MPPQYSTRFRRFPPRTPNTIRKYRLALGLTQRQVAELIGIGPARVSEWERGQTCPSSASLLRLAKALNTLAEALYPQFYLRPEREAVAAASA